MRAEIQTTVTVTRTEPRTGESVWKVTQSSTDLVTPKQWEGFGCAAQAVLL